MTTKYKTCPKCKAIAVDLAKHRCPPEWECCWEWGDSPDDPDADWRRVFAFSDDVAAELYAERHDDENDVVENGVIVWVREPGATEYKTWLVSAEREIRYTASVVSDEH